MNNKIDKLKTDVDDIKNSLNELKNNISLSEDEKKKQAENLKSKAETTKKEIEKEIHSLENKTDDESKKQKEEAETLLDSFNEIMSLYASILNSQESEEWEDELQEEKKGFFKKTKEWVWEQWDDVWDKEKWEEEWWKNLLRTVWFAATWIWAGALIIKWIRKIFGRNYEEEIPWYKDMSRKEKREARKEYRKQKRKEKREKRKKEKESKSFWERPVGKAIKWTGIWTWIYYVIHGLKTGKWDFSHFFDWNKNSPSSEVEDVYNDYIELSEKDPEKYKEYEQIGTNINLMYDEIWDTEKNYFWDNSQVYLWEIWNQVEEKKLKKNEKFQHIDTKWLVVYSLDNFYGNVWEMLSNGGVESYLRCKSIEEYKTRIKQFWAEWFSKVLTPFLAWFASFASFGIVSSDSAEQKMEKFFKWLSENAEEHLAELDLFFRQYTKVLTYMVDKKHAIAFKEAKKIIAISWYDDEKWPVNEEDQISMVEEALKDSDWVEKNLKSTSYWAFLSSNIVAANRILKDEWLDGIELSEALQEIVSEEDANTEKILWWGFDDNALKRAESKINNGQSLDSSDKNWLGKIAENLVEDMWDTKNWWWIYDTFDYLFDAFDLEEGDKQKLLEETGLTQCLTVTVQEIQKLKNDIYTNPTKENIEKFKNLVGQYTSMKKELHVALYAMQESRDNKTWTDYLVDTLQFTWWFFKHFWESLKHLFGLKPGVWDFINIFAWLVVTWGAIKLAGRIRDKPLLVKGGNFMKKTWLLPCTLVKTWLWHSRWWWAVKNYIKDMAKTNPDKAWNFMKRKIIDGVLTPNHVWKILKTNPELKSNLWIYTAQSNDVMFKELVKNMFWDGKEKEVDLFIKYRGKTNCLVKYANTGNHLRYEFTLVMDDKAFTALENFDKEFWKLWSNTVQKSYFEAMLKNAGAGDDIDLLTDLMKNEDFKKAITWDNRKLLKKLKISELRELKETDKLDSFVKWEIKAEELLGSLPRFSKKYASSTWEVVENMSEAKKAFNKCIDDAIDVIRHTWDPEGAMVKEITDKLNGLKKDTSLLDEEMECFTKFINKWFEAKYIPDMRNLLKITEVHGWEEIWKKFQRLLSEWKYSDFINLLNNKSDSVIQKAIKNAWVNTAQDIVSCFRKVHNVVKGSEMKSVVKWFVKIIAKIL